MSKITLEPNSSGAGTFSIVSPDSNTNRTLNLPDESGNILSNVSDIPGSNITGQLVSSNMPAGAIIQVKHTHYTNVASFSAPGFNGIQALPFSVSIQPISTQNKILIIATWNGDWTRSNAGGGMILLRDGSEIGSAPDPGNGYFVMSGFEAQSNQDQSWMSNTLQFLDSPNSVSNIEYKMGFKGDQTYYLNQTQSQRQATDGDDGVSASYITVMEVAG